jgi:hypothetical protein
MPEDYNEDENIDEEIVIVDPLEDFNNAIKEDVNKLAGVKRIDLDNPPQEISYLKQLNDLQKKSEENKSNNMVDYSNSTIGNILANIEMINNAPVENVVFNNPMINLVKQILSQEREMIVLLNKIILELNKLIGNSNNDNDND